MTLLKTQCVFCQASILTTQACCGYCDQYLPKRQQQASDHLAAFDFTAPIDTLIHRIKYAQQFVLADTLGKLTSQQLIPKIKQIPQAIIPIPLHPIRLRERGFNQAHLLAKPLAKQLNIPLFTRHVIRKVHTPAQAQLNAQQRQANMQQAFELIKPIPYQHIALFDDVITTGATMKALVKLLKTQEGIEQIDLYCCASTNTY